MLWSTVIKNFESSGFGGIKKAPVLQPRQIREAAVWQS